MGNKGDLTISLGVAIQAAQAHLNEMEAIHGPESILTEQARVALRYAQDLAYRYMMAD